MAWELYDHVNVSLERVQHIKHIPVLHKMSYT